MYMLSLVIVALIWPWPWLKVIAQHMFWNTLPQNTTVPNVVSQPHGHVASLPLTQLCDLDLGSRSPYKPTHLLKRLATRYHCANLDVYNFNSFQEKWQSCFLDIWSWQFDLDLGWKSPYYVNCEAHCHKGPLCQLWCL